VDENGMIIGNYNPMEDDKKKKKKIKDKTLAAQIDEANEAAEDDMKGGEQYEGKISFAEEE
jgi:hypothetical protein